MSHALDRVRTHHDASDTLMIELRSFDLLWDSPRVVQMSGPGVPYVICNAPFIGTWRSDVTRKRSGRGGNWYRRIHLADCSTADAILYDQSRP